MISILSVCLVYLYFILHFREGPCCFLLFLARLLLVVPPLSSAEKIVIADAASGGIVGEVHVDTALIDHAALERMNSEGHGRDPKRLIGARYGIRKLFPKNVGIEYRVISIPWSVRLVSRILILQRENLRLCCGG